MSDYGVIQAILAISFAVAGVAEIAIARKESFKTALIPALEKQIQAQKALTTL